MKKIVVTICMFFAVVATGFSQTVGLRVGLSPKSEYRVGLGLSIRPKNAKLFYQAEYFPFQVGQSDITIEPKSQAGLVRLNYILNSPKSKLKFLTGVEVFGSNYERGIQGVSFRYKTTILQAMIHGGLDLRVSKKLHLTANLPLIGGFTDKSNSEDGTSQRSNRFAFAGFYGYLEPRFGLEIGLF